MSIRSSTYSTLKRRICLPLAACIPVFLLSGCGSEFKVLFDKDDYLPAIIFIGSKQPIAPGLVAITAPNSGADFTTNDATQTLSGTCGADATLSVTGGYTFADSNCDDETWSLDDITLSSSANVITVTATDPYLNSASATQTITLDTTPPDVAITSPNGGADFTTNTASQTISGTCGTDATMSTSIGSFTDSDCSDGTWALTAMTLSEGTNSIIVTATDPYSNTASDMITITYTDVNTIYWSELTGGIKAIYSNKTGENTVLTATGDPLDIALYEPGSQIYWAEDTGTDFRIRYANLDGTGETSFLSSYSASIYHGPTEIEIDQVDGYIYWNAYQFFSSTHNDIWRSSLVSPLAQKWENELPYNYTFSIALDTVNRMIYFNANDYWDIGNPAGSGKNGEMHSGPLDTPDAHSYKLWGTGIDPSSVSLRGTAVDTAGGHVYYVNRAWDTLTIRRRNLSLSDLSETMWITAAGFDIQKLALDLEERKIYWTSRSPNRIYRADLDQAETGIEVFRELSVVPTGIAISY